jgi:hypothetical protein
MGVTIFYEGKAAGKSQIQEVVATAKKYATWVAWDSKKKTSKRATGITITPYPDTEDITIIFDENNEFKNFTKTQFGGIETHKKVIKLFETIEPLLEKVSIYDEGGYWKKHDDTLLAENFAFTESVIAENKKVHPDLQVAVRLDNGRIADFVG